jgi:hypothetical protein
MKKFKEFDVKTHGVKQLSKALVSHAEMLGYKFDCDWGDYDFIKFHENGGCYLCAIPNKEDIISLDEFFKLTPEDVIIEPERFKFKYYWGYQGGGIYEHVNRVCLTQDQIDRIKDIMNEGES